MKKSICQLYLQSTPGLRQCHLTPSGYFVPLSVPFFKNLAIVFLIHLILQQKQYIQFRFCALISIANQKMIPANNKKYKFFAARKGDQFRQTLEKTENESALKQIDRWNVGIEKYSDAEALQQTFSCIREHRVEILDARFCEIPLMLAYISGVNFPKLRKLNVSYSNICSFEVLPRISMPQLELLQLEGNKTANPKPLRKLFLPSLDRLQISRNEFSQCSSLLEADLPQLKRLSIEHYLAAKGPEDLRSLFKMESPFLREISFFRKTRINQPTFKVKLEQKYMN